MEKKGRHFVLVHGACSGAWCWYKLATLLKAAGHRVTALDLGASGIHPKQLDELRSFAEYSQPLTHAMAAVPEKERVVLVGHSFGGANLALAMELFPEKIAVAVFVTAVMPSTTLPPNLLGAEFLSRYPSEHYVDTKFTFGDGPEKPPTWILLGPKYIATKMYQLSSPEDSTLAATLARPTSWFLDDLYRMVITEEKYGSVTRVFVVCKEDQSMTEDFQRWMVERSPPEEVREIEGADHVPMMSKPGELCRHLLQIAVKYE